MTTIYRTFTPDLEVRSGGDGRTIVGLAVPWDAPQRINDSLVEEWKSGAFNHQLKAPNRVAFAREHIDLGGSLIGPVTALRNDAAGLYMEARASKTPLGDETLELVRDGALRDLSIGFSERPGGNRFRNGVTQRVKANLGEIAVVRQGAFGDLATVTGTRSFDDEIEEHLCVRCRQAGTSNLDAARQVLASLPMLPV